MIALMDMRILAPCSHPVVCGSFGCMKSLLGFMDVFHSKLTSIYYVQYQSLKEMQTIQFYKGSSLMMISSTLVYFHWLSIFLMKFEGTFK